MLIKLIIKTAGRLLQRSLSLGSDTYSPVTVSYKSVKAKLVGVLPSQAAMVETKRSRREGLEVAATKSSQSSGGWVVS
jgi:hypothetical protein